MQEDLFDDLEFELSPEMKKRLEAKDKKLKEDIESGKLQKPKDSPFECLGCGS